MEEKLEQKSTVRTPRKLSYEDLENVCHQLSAQAQQLNTQNQKLKAMLNEANLANLYKRLDYLFKVTQETNTYLSVSFKEQCGKEIETLMTPPERESEESETTEETESTE